MRGLDLSGARYGRDFHLTDSEGRARSLADYRGRVVLLFFGFAQCPDVCPTALAAAVEMLKLLGDDARRVQVLFVTLDPERDTAPILSSYMASFHPGFVALRGDLAAIETTAAEFKVFFRKVPQGSSYTIDHTALIYAFDVEGRLRLALRSEQSPREMAEDVRRVLQDTRGTAG